MSPHTLLIGLDGATFHVLDALMADGTMPFLRRAVGAGVRATLRSTIPALTPPAWTSLVTGRGPGAHGIFDFFRKDSPSSRHFAFLTSCEVACPPIWSMATEAGLRSTVLNFPLTFPPPNIRGHVVPGGFMPWRQLRLGCHPKGLFDRLREVPSFNARELALDMAHEAKAIEGCAEEEYEPWIDMHIRRERQWVDVARYLRREEPSEFTAILFDGVDKIQHLCWRFVDPGTSRDSGSPWERRVRDKCREYFRAIDALMGELVDLFGRDTTVVIASDHGFGPQVRTFFVNSWLEGQGHLAWRSGREPASSDATALGLSQLARHVYQIDWARTRAFAPLPSGNGIHIVRRDEAHPGGVPPGEYEAFRARLAAELRGITDAQTGEPVVARVFTREALFEGPHLALAPDLTLELQDGGLLSILASPEVVRRRAFPTGTHRPDGVFVAMGPAMRRGVRLDPLGILDVAPLLLHALDLPVPTALEGRFVAEALDPAALRARPVVRSERAPSSGPGVAQGDLDAEAEAEILRRLQALGYVE
jgi:predicted AlkP superfamily phosphohydrolase/phosphomutase